MLWLNAVIIDFQRSWNNTLKKHAFLFFSCVMTCLSLTLRKKLCNLPKKMFQCLGWMRKKLHTQEFQLRGSNGNMRCKLLQKRFTGKTTVCSKHLRHIAIEKDVLSELNWCTFQISLTYIKLDIPKILFILVLCSFHFYFKITWPPPPTELTPSPNNITPYQNKNFWHSPPPHHPPSK